MTIGRLIVIIFWVVVILLAAYTFYSERVRHGEEKEASRPTYTPQRPASTQPGVKTEDTGGRIEVVDYSVGGDPDNSSLFTTVITLKNVGSAPIRGAIVTIFPFRGGVDYDYQQQEVNIDERHRLWNTYKRIPVTGIDPGESETVSLSFIDLDDSRPTSGYDKRKVHIKIIE